MRRRQNIQLVYNELIDVIIKGKFRPWTNIYRERLSRANIGLFYPLGSIISDSINEMHYLDHFYTTSSLFYHEPHNVWYVEGITEDNIDEITYPTGINPVIVTTQDEFLVENFEELEEIHSISVDELSSITDGRLLFGDVKDDVGIFTIYMTDKYPRYIPDKILTFDASVVKTDLNTILGSYVITDIEHFVSKSSELHGRGYHFIDDKISEIISVKDLDGSDVDFELLDIFSDSKEYFDTFDFNGNGAVDPDDLDAITNAIGTSYKSTTVDEWNNYYNKMDINKDGVIDNKDLKIFMENYPSIQNTGSVVYIDGTEKVTITYTTWGNGIVNGTVIDNGEQLIISPSIIVDSDRADNIPSDVVDITYDFENDVWYSSSNARKAVIVFKKRGSSYYEEKIPLGGYYDHEVRGIKWKEGFLYVLLHRSKPSTSTRILVFDTKAMIVESYIDDLSLTDHNLVEPVGLTITDNGVIVVSDVTEIHFFVPYRDKAWFDDANSRLYFHQKPTGIILNSTELTPLYVQSEDTEGNLHYGAWNSFDEYGLAPYGLERIPGESNIEFHQRMTWYLRHTPDTTLQGLVNGVNLDLNGNIFTASKPQFALTREPDSDILLYLNNIPLPYTLIQSTDGVRTLSNGNRALISIDYITLTIEDPDIAGDFDITYKDIDGDEYTNRYLIDTQYRKQDRRVDVIPLGSDEAQDPTYGLWNSAGQPTTFFQTLMREIILGERNTYETIYLDEDYFDSVNRVPGISVFPTQYGVYTSYPIIRGGVGSGEDLKVLSITDNINRNALRSYLIPPDVGIDLSVSADVLNRKWYPVVHTGFFYIQDREYYLYNKKVVQVIAGTTIGNPIALTRYPSGYTPIMVHYFNGGDVPSAVTGTYDPNYMDITATEAWYSTISELEFTPFDHIERGWDVDSSEYTYAYDKYTWDADTNSIVFTVDTSGKMLFIVYEMAANEFITGQNWDNTIVEENIMPLSNGMSKSAIVIEDDQIETSISNIPAYYISIDSDNITTSSASFTVQVLDRGSVPIVSKPVVIDLYREIYNDDGEQIDYTVVQTLGNNSYTYINTNSIVPVNEFGSQIGTAQVGDNIIPAIGYITDSGGTHRGEQFSTETDDKGVIRFTVTSLRNVSRIRIRASIADDSIESTFYMYSNNTIYGRYASAHVRRNIIKAVTEDGTSVDSYGNTIPAGYVEVDFSASMRKLKIFKALPYYNMLENGISPTASLYYTIEILGGLLYIQVFDTDGITPLSDENIVIERQELNDIAFYGSTYAIDQMVSSTSSYEESWVTGEYAGAWTDGPGASPVWTDPYETANAFVPNTLSIRVNGVLLESTEFSEETDNKSFSIKRDILEGDTDAPDIIYISYKPNSDGAGIKIPSYIGASQIISLRTRLDTIFRCFDTEINWFGGEDGRIKGRADNLIGGKTPILQIHFEEIIYRINELIDYIETTSTGETGLERLDQLSGYFVTWADIINIDTLITNIDTIIQQQNLGCYA